MSSDVEHEVRLLVDAIDSKYHYDFRSDSMASLERRLEQASRVLDGATISGLQSRVVHEPAVFTRLLDFLTVQVSEMFRDPAYFKALRARVTPLLATYPSLKVWVAGCGMGQELSSQANAFEAVTVEDRIWRRR